MRITQVDGRAFKEYIYLNGEPLAFVEDNEMFFIHGDHLGTPQYMTDSEQSVVWQAKYYPYGEVELPAANRVTLNLRFAGQYHDVSTGLYHNYHRDYDPSIGQYIQADPIGLNGGMGLYLYANDNPIMFVDPLGLLEVEFLPMPGMKSINNNSFKIKLMSPSFVDTVEDTVRKQVVTFLLGRFAGGVLSCTELFINTVVKHDKFIALPIADLDNMRDNDLILMEAAMEAFKEMNKPARYYRRITRPKAGIDQVHFVGGKSLNDFVDKWYEKAPKAFDKNFGSKDEFKGHVFMGFFEPNK